MHVCIYLSFRCDIPVVIMGETGCGKTRLIRYMCNLQTWDSGVKNLVMLKVNNNLYIVVNSNNLMLLGPWWNNQRGHH